MIHYLSGSLPQNDRRLPQVYTAPTKPAYCLSGQVLCLTSDERLLELKKACAVSADMDRLKNILAYEQLLSKYSARNHAS